MRESNRNLTSPRAYTPGNLDLDVLVSLLRSLFAGPRKPRTREQAA
jgi:hypothetical protein